MLRRRNKRYPSYENSEVCQAKHCLNEAIPAHLWCGKHEEEVENGVVLPRKEATNPRAITEHLDR